MDCSIGLTILGHISLFHLEGGGLSGGDIPDDIAREATKVSLLPSGRRGGVAKLCNWDLSWASKTYIRNVPVYKYYCRTHNVSVCLAYISYIAYIACGSASLYF